MKINKALKTKNKLVKRADKEFSRISPNNVYRVDKSPTYSAREYLDTFLKTTEEIIELKTNIHKANFNVFSKIFRMSELKNVISKLRRINTNEPHNYGESTDIVYNTEISEKEIDEMIEKFELEIEQIQEELDVHNHTKDL